MDTNNDPNIERRRYQNRMAQRRFRSKQKGSCQVVEDLFSPDPPTSQQEIFEFTCPSTIEYNSNASLSSMSLTAAENRYTSGSSDLTAGDSHSPVGSYDSGIGTCDNALIPLVRSTQDAINDARPVIGWLGPIHMAAKKGHDEILRLLIEKSSDCNERDSDGTTPLMLAVAGGHEDATDTLLRHGARVAEVDSQRRSALHWAVFYRREAILKILLRHCTADNATTINGYDDTGRTPLHTAIDEEFVTGVEILLARGADVSCKAQKSVDHDTDMSRHS